MKRILLCLSALCAATATPALANDLVTAAEALKWLEDPSTAPLVRSHLQASSVTLTVANGDLLNRGQRPLFCSPAKLALTSEQNVAIFRLAVMDDPTLADFPIYVVLLHALKKKFPCES